jgi:hypothetical protein
VCASCRLYESSERTGESSSSYSRRDLFCSGWLGICFGWSVLGWEACETFASSHSRFNRLATRFYCNRFARGGFGAPASAASRLTSHRSHHVLVFGACACVDSISRSIAPLSTRCLILHPPPVNRRCSPCFNPASIPCPSKMLVLHRRTLRSMHSEVQQVRLSFRLYSRRAPFCSNLVAPNCNRLASSTLGSASSGGLTARAPTCCMRS